MKTKEDKLYELKKQRNKILLKLASKPYDEDLDLALDDIDWQIQELEQSASTY